MSESAVLPERVGNRGSLTPDEVYLMALTGKDIPEDAIGRSQAIAVVSHLEMEPGESRQKLPDADMVADGLRFYPATMITLHTAAERLDGYRTTGDKVADGAFKTVGVVAAVGEAVFGAAGGVTRSRFPMASRVLRGAAGGVALTSLLADEFHGRKAKELASKAHAYVCHAYGEYIYKGSHLAPWMWAALLGRLSKVDAPDEALVRIGDGFLRGYRASLDGRTAGQTSGPLREMHRQLAPRADLITKMITILNAGSPLSERSSTVQSWLARNVRHASQAL